MQALESQALAGHYYLQGVREVGSELLLHPDGRFDYFLAYGAYDESATGTWTVQGGRVLLNTAGTMTPPCFRLKQSASQPEKPLTILVQNQNGRGVAGIDISIDYGDKNPETGYTQEYGWQAAKPRASPRPSAWVSGCTTWSPSGLRLQTLQTIIMFSNSIPGTWAGRNSKILF